MPMQLKYIFDEYHKPMVIRMMGRLWRNYKSELSIDIRDSSKGPNSKRTIELLKPSNVDKNEWEAFVKERLSPAFIVSTS